MSYQTSLKMWSHQGILDRELDIYRKLPCDKLIVVPDTHPISVPGFTILYNKWGLGDFWYAILAPFLYRKELRQCCMMRGHNGRSLLTVCLASILYSIPLVLKFGYIWSLDAKHRKKSMCKIFLIQCLECVAVKRATAILVSEKHQKCYLTETYGV